MKDGPRSSARNWNGSGHSLVLLQKREWVPKNPACDLQAPEDNVVSHHAVYTQEMLQILVAIDKYKDEFPGRGAENARKMRSLMSAATL